MPKWEYRRLVVWSFPYPFKDQLHKDNRGWYLEYPRYDDLGSALFGSKLYAGGSKHTRLPLNPDREWEHVPLYELVTWDDEAGWAELATEAICKLGESGWELAGIHTGIKHGEGFYFFKRPQA